MARLLADEHFPTSIVYNLRALGHDVTTVREISNNKSGDGINDAQVLQYAVDHNRAVLTSNLRDFRALAKENPGHRGVVACPASTLQPRKQARIIDRKIKDVISAFGVMNGQWVWCDFKP